MPGPKRIAEIEEHKVKTGESIKSLADANGMTWQELAKFNWSTDVPDEINKHLRDEIGCTKKTRDGYNYMFDDSDDPGIIYIPTRWSQVSLQTDTTHTIRVRQLTFGKSTLVGCIWIRFLSPYYYPVPYVSCRLIGGNGQWPVCQTDIDGEVFWDETPLDDYSVQLNLGSLSMSVAVPWLNNKKRVHLQRLSNAREILGRDNSSCGTQVRLSGLGYDCQTSDGNLGASPTASAVQRFQEDRHFSVDGVCRAELQEVLAAAFGA